MLQNPHQHRRGGRRRARLRRPWAAETRQLDTRTAPRRDKTRPTRTAPGHCGTKLALHTPSHRMCGIKLALLAQNGPNWHVLRAQGELYTAVASKKPRRANFIPHARQRRGYPKQHTRPHCREGRRRDRRAWLRCPWAVTGPGCGAHGQQRHHRLPNFARNLSRSFFETPQKRCNSNDANSMFEQAAGELRAKLMGGGGGLAELRGAKLRHTPATQRRRCEGRRRDRRAWLRCPWAVAGPGQASRCKTEAHVRDPAPLV